MAMPDRRGKCRSGRVRRAVYWRIHRPSAQDGYRLPRAASSAATCSATAAAARASMSWYRSMTSRPNGVSSAPPPRRPPRAVATTGARKPRFRLSTSSHARRYDIPIARPAAEIEPDSPMSSSSRTLPGPSRNSAVKSRRRLRRAGAFFAGLMVLVKLVLAPSPASAQAPAARAPRDTITVFAASDLALAFAEIGPAFERATGTAARMVMGSTGTLARQIERGAPADVFFAANVAYVDSLRAHGAVLAGSQRLYARGRIVVATARQTGLAIGTLADLARPEVKRVAIANPLHAPYGQAARQALASAGLWGRVSPKLVYGENVRQALQMVQTGAVDAGIIALSVASVPEIVFRPVDERLHRPLDQAAAVVAASRRRERAEAFLEWVTEGEGKAVLARHGFVVPASRAP